MLRGRGPFETTMSFGGRDAASSFGDAMDLGVERFDLRRELGVGESRQISGIALGLFRRRTASRRHVELISKI